jgi:hypothetical protein
MFPFGILDNILTNRFTFLTFHLIFHMPLSFVLLGLKLIALGIFPLGIRPKCSQ